ncbi:uncharacterized protein EI97DRAFT_455301 [Westerdykella ornata]|uniref:Uncharacterized protein n=1 Tax=Westerdykella ornata TaxID=318751 RepID=A0A6A6JVZ2_WESOR|nr:uncharacterized protein EI97DRAFT_455301 [Westerdykella ornata]KAF2280405.1 hypothetical protein EI97DRAFT_455301 [Westerdykella ornata]
MDELESLIGADRFVLYETWTHESSTIYRFQTLGTWNFDWSRTTEINFIFLKVQIPTFRSAGYDALEATGLELDPVARPGLFNNALPGVLHQKSAFRETTSGADILAFCCRNLDQVRIAVGETVRIRVFLIVWEPDGSKEPSLDGLKEFATETFRTDALKNAMPAQFKAIAKTALRADLGCPDSGRPTRNIVEGSETSDSDSDNHQKGNPVKHDVKLHLARFLAAH